MKTVYVIRMLGGSIVATSTSLNRAIKMLRLNTEDMITDDEAKRLYDTVNGLNRGMSPCRRYCITKHQTNQWEA